MQKNKVKMKSMSQAPLVQNKLVLLSANENTIESDAAISEMSRA